MIRIAEIKYTVLKSKGDYLSIIKECDKDRFEMHVGNNVLRFNRKEFIGGLS